MVTTRSSVNGVPPDENRIIAVVTGANSGFGLGVCKQLLSNLSLPPGIPLPASTPQPSAMAPSQLHLLDDSPHPTKFVPDDPPPTLTLILACRSASKAAKAKKEMLQGHMKELKRRKEQGHAVREGWVEGLRVVVEPIDLDAVGGNNGVLAFCERVKSKYPHITSLYLNAGLGPYTGVNFLKIIQQFCRDGFYWFIANPQYMIEAKGVMSADGERGMTWGVNVLAPYIMAKELAPLMRKSPAGLPFAPRIIYTSSFTATLNRLHSEPLNDPQLLDYGEPIEDSVYKASKYIGDLVMLQLDQELSPPPIPGDRTIRVLLADPGLVTTGILGTALDYPLLETIFTCIWELLFAMNRWFGSTVNPMNAAAGALVMLYAALVDERYIQPCDRVPAQKFVVHSHRWGGQTTVDYGEVDQWEDTLDIGRGMVKACETARLEWRRREGLE